MVLNPQGEQPASLGVARSCTHPCGGRGGRGALLDLTRPQVFPSESENKTVRTVYEGVVLMIGRVRRERRHEMGKRW